MNVKNSQSFPATAQNGASKDCSREKITAAGESDRDLPQIIETTV